MTAPLEPDDSIPLFALATTLVRNRWRIVLWAIVGGVIALAPVINKPLTYRAAASFIPQGYSATSSGLAGLAGQFGLSLGASGGNASLSPEFYVRLVKSRVVLQPIVHDSFVVQELGPQPRPLMDLLNVPVSSPESREERAIEALSGMITPSISKTTGVVELGVASEYRSLALAVTNKLIDGLNDYNQRVRLSAAVQERKQVESRLAIANQELRDAEAQLDAFQRANRSIGSSPELSTQRDRLQRNVALKQSLYTSLATSYEDVRVREARDAPVISIFEPPAVPTKPQPRGRFGRLLFGLMLGAIFGVFATFTSSFMANRRAAGDVDAMDFLSALRGMRDDLTRPFAWLARKRVRSS